MVLKMSFHCSYDSALLYDSIEALRILYGDLSPGVTNVVYTNGEMDMWFPRGMQESYPGGEVINIPCKYPNGHIVVGIDSLNILFYFLLVYAKSADLRSISEFDGNDLRNAKQRIQQLVTEWGQY